MRFAQRDVYIPSPAFAEYYCRRFATIDRDENCRSLTFRVEPSHAHAKPLPSNTGEANARSISTLLYQADTLNYLPNLRRVTIEYIGTNFRDLYDQSRLLSMPKEVRHLEIKYSPQSHDTDYTIMAHQPIYLPNITKLSVSGIPDLEMPILASLCPNIEELEIESLLDMHSFQVKTIVPSLVDASATRNMLFLMFNYSETFRRGDSSTFKRIILRSNDMHSNDAEFKKIQELCRKHDVFLVSEPVPP